MLTYFHDIGNQNKSSSYIKIFIPKDNQRVTMYLVLGCGSTFSELDRGIELIEQLHKRGLDYEYLSHDKFMELTE